MDVCIMQKWCLPWALCEGAWHCTPEGFLGRHRLFLCLSGVPADGQCCLHMRAGSGAGSLKGKVGRLEACLGDHGAMLCCRQS